MSLCKRASSLIPVTRQALAPSRTFFSRRSPWGLMDISRTVEDMEKAFNRMEREMNSTFRDLARFGFPRLPRFNCDSSFFPAIETETSQGDSGRKYMIRMHVGEGVKPEDVKISLKDRIVTIEAKVDQKSEDGKSRLYQEVSQSFTLPENVKVEEVKSVLSPDGTLTFEAPLPEIESSKPKEIPISVDKK